MVGVAIFDNTEGEGHPMLGIVAINHEHMERWHACVGMHVSACRKNKKKNILVEWWTWAHRHADGLRVHVMWISVKEKKRQKKTYPNADECKEKEKTTYLGLWTWVCERIACGDDRQ